ncbi:hypothetical protein KFE25_006945 [Diacronema lutheri]|uniref:Uncharacterized protein n=1 Tax=Diacronema lutheri TaxID=2081491 RepID=A0A8J5XMR6_DIALT|nr:hypothetical protein KFE25_006945 [Diacronema lutheri]
MNGLLAIVARSTLGEQPAVGNRAVGGGGEEGAQPFSSPIATAFGTMTTGSRPVCLEWAPVGLRLLVCSWDGSVDIVDGSTGAGEALGEAHAGGLTWRVRSACSLQAPIDAARPAPQACWLPSGLAFAVALEERTACGAAPWPPARTSLLVVLAPPQRLCGMAPTVIERIALDEPLAGLAACCSQLVLQPNAVASAHLLAAMLNGALRAVPLPEAALIGEGRAQAHCLCQSASERVYLCAGDGAQPSAKGARAQRGGVGAWELHVVRTAASEPREAQRARGGEIHPLARVCDVDWLDVVETVSHALARPLLREPPFGAHGGALCVWGVRVGVSGCALLLVRSNVLFWLLRGAPPPDVAPAVGERASEGEAWRALIAAEPIAACCACSDDKPYAATVGTSGMISVWCLRTACNVRCVPLRATVGGWHARACIALAACVVERAARSHAGKAARIDVRICLVDFDGAGAERDARCAPRCGGLGADTDGGAVLGGDGLCPVRLLPLWLSNDGEATVGEWRERRVQRGCSPQHVLGLHITRTALAAEPTATCRGAPGMEATLCLQAEYVISG